MGSERAAGVLRAAYGATLSALDLADLTATALASAPAPRTRVTVLALGKSAGPMLAGALRVLGPRVAHALVARPTRSLGVPPAATAALAQHGCHVAEFVTGHPLPDEASVRAGEAALRAMRALGDGDDALVLLSGGASAAACAPPAGVSLADLRATVQALLAAGLPIHAVNNARGRVDRVKHGGLARAAGAACVTTLLAADVLGDDDTAARAVGSAPTLTVLPDEALLAAARAALPAGLRRVLDAVDDAPAPAQTGARDLRTIATPATARAALADALASRGLRVATLPDAADDVATVAARYAAVARTLVPGEARVAVGEPTVSLPAHPGRGGRAGRLALLVAQALADVPGVAFLAGATDGVDGESGAAGAVVTDQTSARAHARGVDVATALARFDDGAAHAALGTALVPGPTGINLLDLHALVRL